MKYSLKLLLILLATLLAACSQLKGQQVLEVKVNSDRFVVGSRTYATSAELTAALRTMSRPDAVGLIQEDSISPERHNEATAAIQKAYPDMPISFVGNEVFY